MGFLFENYSVLTVLSTLVLIATLIIFNELSRRSLKASYFFYVALPIILTVLIVLNVVHSPSTKSWFGVVKTYSALLGVWGFMVIRFTKLGRTKFAWFFPYAILGINILEAVYRDLEVFFKYQVPRVSESGLYMIGGPWNVMNAIAGVLCIITMTGWVGIKISKTPSKDMVWTDQLWFWIVAYDVWNIAYCYNCISNRAMYTGVVLITACTVAEFLFKRGVWLQHRAQTLALFGMFSLAFNYQAFSGFQIVSTNSPTALFILSFSALVVNVGLFIYELYVIKKYKRNPLKQEVFTHLKAYKMNLEANGL